MARDYGTRRTTKQKSNAPHQLLVIAVSFLLGYFTASVVDLENLSHWLNTQVLAPHETTPHPTKSDPKKAALPPKPKFEFYTLLANEKKNGPVPATKSSALSGSKQVTPGVQAAAGTSVASTKQLTQHPGATQVAEGKPQAPMQGNKGAFLVQVAAFKAKQDADQMKGLLTLKGFNVRVVPVSNARGNWFRVVIGPYLNKTQAQQAQASLARNEHLRGMVTPVRG